MTQTMRERLIRRLYQALPNDDWPYVEGRTAQIPAGTFGGKANTLGDVIDTILAELRTYIPAKEAVFVRFRDDGDGGEDNYYADETDAEVFAAMIDAVREGR